ncbi:unnamed protein product [Closterium sp. NIES-54]
MAAAKRVLRYLCTTSGMGLVLGGRSPVVLTGHADASWEIGFTSSTTDHSLFMLGEGEQRSFIVVYVDDILIFSPSSDLVKEVMLKVQDKFKCKALGDVSFYLGLHIERDVEKRCMRVHQRKYLEVLAANFGQSEGHVATPFPSGFKCVKGPKEERRSFHSLVGSPMYAAVNTRPDVAFATGQLARVVQCPNEEQVAAGMRVAKYLGQTPTVGLQYSAAAQRRQKGADGVEPGRLFLTAFSDASYASEPEDMTSVGGFICFFVAQRDYELLSLDFSTAFLQVYGLRQAPREWHDTLRTTLAALGFAPSNADPSLFLRTDTTLPPFYILVYVDDLVFATGDTKALALVLQRFRFQYSSPQPTPLSTGHSLSAPPSDESVEPSGPYPELVGCLMYLMTSTRPDLAYPLSLMACNVAPELRWLTYLLSDLEERPRSPPVLYVDNKEMFALCREQRLEHRMKHIALHYFLARELQQRGQLRLADVSSQANTANVFTKAVTALGLVPTLPHLLVT